MQFCPQELEQIEEHWRQESRDLLEMVTRLQEENRRLASAVQETRSDSEDSGKQSTINFFSNRCCIVLIKSVIIILFKLKRKHIELYKC